MKSKMYKSYSMIHSNCPLFLMMMSTDMSRAFIWYISSIHQKPWCQPKHMAIADSLYCISVLHDLWTMINKSASIQASLILFYISHW